MRKLYWFLIIVGICFGVYALFPGAKGRVDQAVNDQLMKPGMEAFKNIYASVTNNPTWKTYVAPYVFFIGIVGGFIGFYLLGRWRPKLKKAKEKIIEPMGPPTPIGVVHQQPASTGGSTASTTQLQKPTESSTALTKITEETKE